MTGRDRGIMATLPDISCFFERMPALDLFLHDAAALTAIAVFLATYVFIAIGKLPGYHLDRAGAALLGACLMVWLGVISLDEAYAAIDFNTIALLLGMMIVVANLRLSGFFQWINDWVIVRARHPVVLLAAIVGLSGVLSALLVNDTLCVVMTPLVLDLTQRLRRDPVPYLMAVAMASNIGSVATLTGNPQNMIVGSLSHIPYAAFTAALAPVALVGLLMTVALIALIYRGEFLTRQCFELPVSRPVRYLQPVVLKSLAVLAVMVLLFLAGQPVAKVAILGGAYLLFTRRIKAHKVYREIDWPLLVMFAGLFVVIAAFERVAVTPAVIAEVARQHLDHVGVLTLLTAGLSNLVSNVPAVLMLKSLVGNLPDPERAWLVVAMASTLAGNFTLVGSVANLIVAQRAQGAGVRIGFGAYFKVGAPLTVMSMAFGVLWL